MCVISGIFFMIYTWYSSDLEGVFFPYDLYILHGKATSRPRFPSFPVCLLHQQQQTFLPEPILRIFPSDLPRRGNNRQKQDLENWNIRVKLSESE